MRSKVSLLIRESRDGIELNWIPPLEPNGDVYYLIDDGNRIVNTSSSSRGSTYFNLTGLQRGVTYNTTVVAVNSAGRNDTGPVLYYTHNEQSKYLSICDNLNIDSCHSIKLPIAYIWITALSNNNSCTVYSAYIIDENSK